MVFKNKSFVDFIQREHCTQTDRFYPTRVLNIVKIYYYRLIRLMSRWNGAGAGCGV